MTKYASLEKTKRNLALAEYRKTNQNDSLQEIADVFGISVQRVHQILTRLGVETVISTSGESPRKRASLQREARRREANKNSKVRS